MTRKTIARVRRPLRSTQRLWRGALPPALLAAVLWTAGCAVSPEPRFYALSDATAPLRTDARPAKAAAGLRLTVGPVSLPELVDRPQLVTASGSHRVHIADFHRWAEPLHSAIPRILARDLAAELGSDLVAVAGQAAAPDPDVRVAMDVQRFEAELGRAVRVEALWKVSVPRGEARSGRSVAEERVDAGDHAAVAAAYSRALARVARDIAQAVAALRPG